MKKKLVILLLSTFILLMAACGQKEEILTPIDEVASTQWEMSESNGINISNEKALKITFDNGMPIYLDSESDWVLSDILTVDGSKAIITKDVTNQFNMSFKVKDIDNEDTYINGTVYNYVMDYDDSAILETKGCWILVQENDVSYKAIYDDGSVTFTVVGYDGIGSCDITQVFESLRTLIYPGNDIDSLAEYDILAMKEITGKMVFDSKFKNTLLLEDFKEQSGLTLEKTADMKSFSEEYNTGYTIISDTVDHVINQKYENGTSITINLNTDSDYINNIFVAPYDSSLNLLNIDSEKIENITLRTLYETIGTPDVQYIDGVYGEYSVFCTWDNVTFFFNDKGENIGYIINLR